MSHKSKIYYLFDNQIFQLRQLILDFLLQLGDEKDSTLGDFIPDEKMASPEKIVLDESLKIKLKEVLNDLTKREQEVLILRFIFIFYLSYFFFVIILFVIMLYFLSFRRLSQVF